jgi:thiol:disulfide interchange protein
MIARRHWLSFLLLFVPFLAPLPAQEGTLTLTAAFEPATAKPGDKVVLVLRAEVSEGWHAYGTLEQTNLPVGLAAEKVVTGGLELDGPAVIPPGVRTMKGSLATFPLPNRFTVRQPMRVPAAMAGGEVTVRGELDYGICDENSCLPPDVAAFTAKLVVAGDAAAGTRPETKPGLRLDPDQKIVVAAKVEPAPARAGEVVQLVLTVTITDPEFHAYGALETVNLPVQLEPQKLDAGALEAVGPAVVPPGTRTEKSGMVQFPLPHVFEVTQALRVPATQRPGTIEISGALTVQICNARGCLAPEDVDFEAALTVEAGAARTPATFVGPSPVPKDPPPIAEAVRDDGSNPFLTWWGLILACIGGGLFALAMPCTYPMIPITFSFFTKQAEKRGGKVMPLALAYAGGIVLMFTGIGAAVALASETVDDQTIIALANHWLLNSVIAIAFLMFACTLFGWINLQPPQFLTNAAGKAGATGGYLGVFLMGATLVITSFTCTAPIVGTLLASVVTAGPVRIILGMSIFGLTMALPFLFLSLAPTRVKALPRSGEWMETLKVSLGFVELAATLKFVSMVDIALDWNALPRELFLLLIAVIFALWALYLFGILRKAGSANEGVGAGRMASGMAVTLVAAYLFFGAMGYKLDYYMTAFAPPYSAPVVGARAAADGGVKAATHVIVKDDGDAALVTAKAADKLLLYNFTGFN